MKRTLLFVCSALLGMSAWAQTDVTSTYLDNAGFDIEGDYVTTAVCTYAKDVAGNSADGSSLMAVTGWTAGDSGDAKAGACFGFGTGAWVANSSSIVPATNSEGEAEGGALGLGGCWGGNAYYTQPLKQNLAAGTYKIEICGYNAGTATAFGTQTIGIKEANGTTHYVSTTWTVGQWVKATLDFEVTEETEATFYVGATGVAGGSASSAKLFIDYVKIISGLDLSTWNNAKANAEEIMGSYEFEESDEEMTNLFNEAWEAYDKADPTSVSQMNEMVSTLNNAVAAFKALADNRLLERTNQGLTTFINTILEEYPYTSESVFDGNISKWSGSTYVTNNGNEHWSGVKPTPYYEQSGSQWGQDAWSISAQKTVTLPAGKYAFVVTARASMGTTSVMTVDGEEVELSHLGPVGYGIATDGEATYNLNKTFANGGKGYGWEYASAEFTLTEAREVTIAFAASASSKYNWVSIANPVLYYNEDAKAAMELADIKAELDAAIKDVTIPTANIGDYAFQYPTEVIEALNTTMETAQEVLESNTATIAEVEAQIANVEGIVLPDLNTPNEDARFAWVLTNNGDWGYENKAITYMANGRADAGLYNIQYASEFNINYAQAFLMTHVAGNQYKMSQLDVDGVERYICTGSIYGGNAYQLRTTTNEEQALLVELVASPTEEGIYKLWNSEAGQYIGSQDAGVFTVNSHTNFSFMEMWPGKADYIDIFPENQYATLCCPYIVTLMTEDIQAYTVDGIEENGTTLVITELEGNQIPASTPVLLYAENGGSNQHAGWGTANPKTNMTRGLLTGTFDGCYAPVGSYVLQNQDSKVGFYQVENEEEVPVPANKAYLNVPASDAKAFMLNTNATAIQAVEALTAGKAQIYDLNGRQLQKLQKGINIVNGVKVLVK